MFSQSHLLLVFNVFMYPVYGTILLTEQISLFYLTYIQRKEYRRSNHTCHISRCYFYVEQCDIER